MARYRKKPVEVEAVQWTGNNLDEIADLLGIDLDDDQPPSSVGSTGQGEVLYVTDDKPPALIIRTVHGETAAARIDDWVIPEPVRGRGYPCKPDIFAATYEPVD